MTANRKHKQATRAKAAEAGINYTTALRHTAPEAPPTEELPFDAAAEGAVIAYRDVEKARLLLDKKEAELSARVRHMAITSSTEARATYFRLTTDIDNEFEAKREKLGL